MNIFFTLAFLFFMGSVIGWIIELLFRRFSIYNKERKWINPGFCTGPYLPLYGFGLCLMYLLSSVNLSSHIKNDVICDIISVFNIGICMTALEYIAGIICVKCFNVRLWDYSDEWGNIQGIICPLFSAAWLALGIIYYFFIHPHILDALIWLSNNLAFSFFIGLFFGIFTIDVIHSAQLIMKLKKFADDHNVIVKYENIKAHIRSIQDRTSQHHHFLFPFKSELPISEHLKDMLQSFETRIKKQKK